MAEGEVVLLGTFVVAVADDEEACEGVIFDDFGSGGEVLALILFEVVAVESEVDGGLGFFVGEGVNVHAAEGVGGAEGEAVICEGGGFVDPFRAIVVVRAEGGVFGVEVDAAFFAA